MEQQLRNKMKKIHLFWFSLQELKVKHLLLVYQIFKKNVSIDEEH